MTNELLLSAIEHEVDKLGNASYDENLNTYVIIRTMVKELEDHNPKAPMLSEYTTRLLWSTEALAGLDNGNHKSVTDHKVWALSAIQNIKSPCCLNID